MHSGTRRGLEVYDFPSEDEFPDPSEKFRNPSRRDRRNPKHELLKLGRKGANIQPKKIKIIPCVDDDDGDTEHCCKNAISLPKETIEPELASEKDLKFSDAYEQKSNLDKLRSTTSTGADTMCHDHCSDSAIIHSRLGTIDEDAATQSNSHEQQSDLDNNGCKLFSGIQTDSSVAPSSSPGRSRMIQSMGFQMPMRAQVSLHQVPYPKLKRMTAQLKRMMDNVNTTVVLYPDYVVYEDIYCTEVQQLTFSHNGIKISGLALSGNETIKLEWGVDDLINVECQWVHMAEIVMIKLHVQSKDADQGADALGLSGIEELKIGVVEPNWPHQQERIACLNDKYLDILDPVQIMEVDDSHGQRHHFPNFDDDFETFVYPEGDPDSVTIIKRDVDLVQPEIFINDTLIDFYIK